MHLHKRVMPLVVLLAGVLAAGCASWDPKRDENDLRAAQQTIAAFKQRDPGIQAFFDNAYGYAVFPTVGKGGIGVGGAYGEGLVFRGGQWVGRSKMVQATLGFQLGGQAYSELIFFKDRAAFDDFKSGNLKFEAQASAVAVTLGAAAKTAYSGGVAVFTMTKGGLMYEATIGGQSFSYTPR